MAARRMRLSSSGKPQGSMMSSGDAEAGGEPEEGAEILRNIGLEQGEAHGRSSTLVRVAKARDSCGTLSHDTVGRRSSACDQQSLET